MGFLGQKQEDKKQEELGLDLGRQLEAIYYELYEIVEQRIVDGELSSEARASVKQLAIERGANSVLVDTAIDKILEEERRSGIGRIEYEIQLEKAVNHMSDTPNHWDIPSFNKVKNVITSASIPDDPKKLTKLMMSVMTLANRKGPGFVQMKLTGKEDFSLYWWRLYEKLYKRAKVVCPDSPMMPQFTEFYNKELAKKSLVQKLIGLFKKS